MASDGQIGGWGLLEQVTAAGAPARWRRVAPLSPGNFQECALPISRARQATPLGARGAPRDDAP